MGIITYLMDLAHIGTAADAAGAAADSAKDLADAADATRDASSLGTVTDTVFESAVARRATFGGLDDLSDALAKAKLSVPDANSLGSTILVHSGGFSAAGRAKLADDLHVVADKAIALSENPALSPEDADSLGMDGALYGDGAGAIRFADPLKEVDPELGPGTDDLDSITKDLTTRVNASNPDALKQDGLVSTASSKLQSALDRLTNLGPNALKKLPAGTIENVTAASKTLAGVGDTVPSDLADQLDGLSASLRDAATGAGHVQPPAV